MKEKKNEIDTVQSLLVAAEARRGLFAKGETAYIAIKTRIYASAILSDLLNLRETLNGDESEENIRKTLSQLLNHCEIEAEFCNDHETLYRPEEAIDLLTSYLFKILSTSQESDPMVLEENLEKFLKECEIIIDHGIVYKKEKVKQKLLQLFERLEIEPENLKEKRN